MSSEPAPTPTVHADDRSRGAPLRLLVFSSLYPNAAQPRHGIFVEERLRHLLASGRVTATVVAPVPWFPFKSARFGSYAAHARVPARERRHGIEVLHPRYPVIPKVGMNLAPGLMARAVLPLLRRLQNVVPGFDLIDAHYLYPDGVAAVLLGQRLDLPVVMSARGSDVTRIAAFAQPRRRILQAIARARATITVSSALRARLVELGADPARLQVLRNGVDLARFAPQDRAAARRRLGLAGIVWLTVGNLVELKGVHLVIEALGRVADATLVVAGDGPEAANLRRLAEACGVAARVRFLGNVPHAALATYYNAADALMQASSREGMPNVVLEALACGTPVVAAPFAGVEEVLLAPAAGRIADARSVAALVDAWLDLQGDMPSRAATRRCAERFGWESVVTAQCALYAEVAQTRAAVAWIRNRV